MPGKLTISAAATRHLDLWADQLQRGEIVIWQLPLALQQFISIGWADGIAHSQQQAREYEHKLNLLWMQAYTPKERHEEYQRRLDQHFQLDDAAFFAADVEDTHDGTTRNRAHAIAHESLNYPKRAA